ncbi:MAG: transcription-repair coupling factor, partial [Aliifodinibius sp.]|nr:transcription-repair coupling factor [Fodinibius sp.]NIV16189.1 transcription-repair coupling factor [Fodinibius sp.]NIY26748.1 transcription-repair coupling factor [Fodinibius sp.]
FTDASLTIRNGDSVEIDSLKEELVDQAYEPVKFVNQPGEFAHRGGILDVYPYSGEYPIRLEFFGDEVDSIREFDPDSQRSVSFLEAARFVPDASSLSKGQKQGVLSYFDEDTVFVLLNRSLIESDIEERFQQASET